MDARIKKGITWDQFNAEKAAKKAAEAAAA